jgi:hypothetical protein
MKEAEDRTEESTWPWKTRMEETVRDGDNRCDYVRSTLASPLLTIIRRCSRLSVHTPLTSIRSREHSKAYQMKGIMTVRAPTLSFPNFSTYHSLVPAAVTPRLEMTKIAPHTTVQFTS